MIKYKTVKDFNVKNINEANTIFKNFLISSSHNKLYQLNKGFNFGVRWSGVKEEFVVDWLTNKSRDIKGNLNYLSGKKKLQEISECEVVELVDSGYKKIKIKDLFNLA